MSTMPSRRPILTEKDLKILGLVIQGSKVNEIATELHLSPHYVYFLLRLMRLQFWSKTNAELVTQAIAQGVISPDGMIPENIHEGSNTVNQQASVM